MEVLPLTGGAAAAAGRARRAGSARAGWSPLLGRPRPVRARRRGAVLRRPHPDAGRPGASSPSAPARRCTPSTCGSTATRTVRAAAPDRLPPDRGPARRAGQDAPPSCSPTRSRPASPSTRRTGTCCRSCGSTERPGLRGGSVRIGIVSPVLVRRARRRAEPHHGPRRGADRARPRGERAGPGRRGRRAAAVRGGGRPGAAAALQRVGRPDRVRPGLHRPGAPLAGPRRVRRAARARAADAQPVPAGRALGARPGGRHLPHRDDPVPGAVGRPGPAPARAREDHRPDRGQRAGPQGAGRAPRRRRGGDPQRGGGGQVRRRAAPLPGWPGDGRRRSASSAGSPSRARASTLLRTAFVTLARQRPGLRLLVAGPGDRDDLYDDIPADLHDRVEFLGLVSEAGQGPDAAQRRRLRGPEHRRRVASA